MQRVTLPACALLTALGFGAGCSSDTGLEGNGLTGGAQGSGAKGGTGGTSASGGSGGSSASSTGGGIAVGGSSASGGTIGVGGTIEVGGSSNGGSSADGGTTTGGTGGACTGQSATGMKGASASLLFLVDTSRSMQTRVGNATKLAATQTALNASFTSLPDAANVGLLFFPDVGIGAMPCFDPNVEVPIDLLAAAQRTALTTSVNGATADGSTPTHDAYAFAVQTLQAFAAEGDKYVVLITDGEPTYALGCVGTGMADPMNPTPTQPLIDAAQAAFTTNGIKTFVVGTPGSEPAKSALSAMARVGGTGPTGCSDTGPTYCHFDMTETTDVAASLTAALGTIQAQIPVDCAFDLPRPPSGMDLDLDKVNVTITGDSGTMTPVARDPNGDCATDGWRYQGDPPTSVQLCGALCDSVKAQMSPTIDVQFGCTQRVNPPR